MFVLKFYFSNEIRRIALSEQATFATISELVKELFSSNGLSGKFVLKYRDNEDDLITVTSDQELAEAFRVAKSKGPAILRFQIVQVAQPSPSRPSCSSYSRGPCGYGRGFPHPAICDSCNTRIFGLRFKCLNCPDYDLCYQCTSIEGVHDKEHLFMRVHPSAYFAEQTVSSGCCRQEKEQDSRDEDDSDNEEEENKENESHTEVPVEEKEEPQGIEGKQEEKETTSTSAKPEVVSSSSPAPAKELNTFQIKLKQLEEMGFQEKERNIAALLKNSGNLLQTVKELVEA